MATDIAKAYVQIIPSAEGISGNIANVLDGEASKAGASSGKTFGASFGGAIGTGLKVAGAAAGVAAAGVAALGKTIVSNAKETAAYGDNVDKLSQKIGISAEAFQEWDYVFSQNGADIGILESGMKKLSNTVSDAAGGSKSAVEKFKSLGLSIEDLSGLSQEDIFGKVIEQLQAMPEGAERTAIASDLLGRSAMELGPLLNQTAQDTEALKEQAHALGMVMSDDAVKQSAAFTDAMDNMSRAMMGAKNSIVGNLLPGLTEITNGFANLVAGNEGATEQLKSGFTSLAQSITAAIPSVVSGATAIVEAVASVAPEIITTLGSSLLTALSQLSGSLSGVIPQVITAITSIMPQLVQVGLEIITQLTIGIAQALPSLTTNITDVVLQIIDILIQNIPMFLDAGMQLLLGLADGLLQSIPMIVDRIPELVQALVDALIAGMPILIDGTIQLVQGIAEAMPEIITAIVDVLPEIINTIVEALPVMLPALIEGCVQLVVALAAAWPQIIQALIDALPQIVEAIAQGLVSLAPALTQAFTTAFAQCAPAFDQLATMANQSWAKIKAVFTPVAAWFKTLFTNAVNGVKSAWNTVTSFFQQIWQKIVQIFANAPAKFAEIGRNIVEGIKNGINAAWSGIASWLSDKVKSLIESAKSALSIGSPSKAFADEVGQWIPAGIAMGIEQGMGVLNDEIQKMTDDALVGTITATTDSVNSVNYMPSTAVMQPSESRTEQILAQWLPIIADSMKVDVNVVQNDRGTYEAVNRQNSKVIMATGYHALA